MQASYHLNPASRKSGAPRHGNSGCAASKSAHTCPRADTHSLAKALETNQPDNIESAQLYWNVRSEMFYLLGLLYERRGDMKRARKLFKLSVEEDPTLRWPALLSEKKLEEKC